MAITQTGTTQFFNLGTTNSGNVSTAITVPADAELVVAFVSGFGAATFFSGGGMTFTKGGSQVAMVAPTSSAGDTSASFFMGTAWYLALPDTGTNKTMAYDWLGTGTATNSPIVAVQFFKGIDTSSPVRFYGVGQNNAGTNITTNSMTVVSGDYITAAVCCFVNAAEGTTDTWTGLAEISETTRNNNTDMSVAANSAPTGNMTVTAGTRTIMADGTIVALVIKPALAQAFPSIYFGCKPV